MATRTKTFFSELPSPFGPLIWILCLALVSVAAKNFEEGLSVDAPIYATIARQITRTGEWFALDGRVPELPQFAEHPHLGFWILASLFKVLPAVDWVARLPGQFFYVAWLWMFFLVVEKKCDRRSAVWAVLLLWTWAKFSNYFSNVYLDPGTLFFGTAALFLAEANSKTKNWSPFALAGLCLGFCILYKGLTALLFFPALAFLPLLAEKRDRSSYLLRLLFLGVVAAAVVGIYALSVSQSSRPDFFSLYWHRQMTSRFSKSWDWSALIGQRFWGELLRDTNYLAPLALSVFFIRDSLKTFFLPLTLFITATLMYAPAGRVAQQYWMMLMPWLAWMAAGGLLRKIPWNPLVLMKTTAIFCLAAFVLVEFLPIRIHGSAPTVEEKRLKELASLSRINQLIIDESSVYFDVTTSSRFAWYSDVNVVGHVRSSEPVPPATRKHYYLQWAPSESREKEISAQGWCLSERLESQTLWLACDV